MEMMKKWSHKNLENIVIGYLSISIFINAIFYLNNFDRISLFYFNLFLIQSVILILAFGFFLLKFRTKGDINTKGYAYAFIVFSLLTRSATFINYLLFGTLKDKYNLLQFTCFL